MRFSFRTFAAALWILAGGFGVVDAPTAHSQPSQLSEASQVSLITILPGDPVHTFAGHSALRVRDPAHDFDRLYNYGTFNFGDPLFIPKFTYGDLRYYLSVAPTSPMLGVYRKQNRPVIEQSLNLSRAQRTAVYQYLRTNARPDNRYYQYDFFYDNCSTRIRDVLQDVLGPRIDFSKVDPPTRSFRQLLDPYVASRPFLDLGFDLALGRPADQTPSRQNVMFLPVQLLEGFNQATVVRQDSRQPLVSRTDTLQWTSDYQAMEASIDWPFVLSVAFLLLVVAWTGWQAAHRQRPSGLGDAGLLVTTGCVGLGICFLWFVSTYEVTNSNLNILWAWPTHLWAAYTLLRRPSARPLSRYLAVTSGAALLFLLGWPLWPQDFHQAVPALVAAIGLRTGWWTLALQGPIGLRPHSSSSEPPST